MKGISRINRIRTMTTEEMARVIIDANITDKYCKSDCEPGEDFEATGCCFPTDELKCCVRWLHEEWEEGAKTNG